ncbi:MAG: STAS domain-containing protein [Azospirillum sp.]|nr:STAS domain-containing protein [Azospirillum sp.]
MTKEAKISTAKVAAAVRAAVPRHTSTTGSDATGSDGDREPGRSDGRRIAVTGRLTINEVEARRGEFLELLRGVDRLAIDLGGVEAIDAAGLQLLLAMKASAERQVRGLQLIAPWGGPAEPGPVMLALTAAGLCEIDPERAGDRPVCRDETWQLEA